MASDAVPERSEVDEQYNWDLTDLFPTDDAWEAAYRDVEARLEELRGFEGRPRTARRSSTC